MLKSKNKINPKLKPYHIILLAIALCPFLILNSNSVNKRREKEAQLKEDHKFLEKLYLRKLDFKSDVDAICEKGSDDLKEYYTKGDPKSIGIDDDEKIEGEDENPAYITALINLVSSEGEMADNVKEYGMHLLPVIVFFAIAILSLPIWFVYCICCCSNCCCCCCCKKSICKIPFFIVAAALYALVLGISVYGLSQSNSIFVGLADTECSILKFIGEVLDGETKETKPKWAGINGIKGLFEETKGEVNNIDTTDNTLTSGKASASTAKGNFETALQYYSTQLSPTDNTAYKQQINDEDYYCLDIIFNFGTFTRGTPSTATPASSFVSSWYKEFKAVSDNSESQMGTAEQNYGQLGQNKGEAESVLNDGISSIGDMEGSFNDIKEQVSGIIIDYSDKIDKYGKLAFKIIFSVFMVLDIAIAAFITLLLFCSFKFCKSCCCFRCLFKSLLHILWNILAFLTFFVLLLGSIFTLFGTVGKDLISVVSFLVSDKNLNKPEPILVGGAKDYLTKCINGNGDITEDLFGDNLSHMENINKLRTASIEIKTLIMQLEYLKTNTFTYNQYKDECEKRINYQTDNFDLIKIDGSSKLNFRTSLSDLNSHIPNGKSHEWRITCSNSISCDSSSTNSNLDNLCINPNTCQSQDISNWYSDINNYAKVANAFIKSIKTATSTTKSNTSSDGTSVISTNNIITILEDLKSHYDNFINVQQTTLKTFSNKIDGLVDIFNRFAGEGSDSNIYSIVNCKFIGRNAKIILKNLKDSLGHSFYTVGICLEISGISMLISIAFTILLNSIINANTGK